jgi:hypothetical protein
MIPSGHSNKLTIDRTASPAQGASRKPGDGAVEKNLERFRAKRAPGLIRGWMPVRVKKTRQKQKITARF